MTVYLHRPELDELLSEVTKVAEGSDPGGWIEKHGVCASAIATIAEECGEEAIVALKDGRAGNVDEAIANAYLSGFLLGMIAGERVGR